MSFGPILPNISIIGKTKFTAVNPIAAYGSDGNVFRFQGVSIPGNDKLNHEAFELLCKHSEKL
ncbi:MAG: 54S ribosomal protein L39, mitochondrial, partial [Paramarteilia canceri]